MAAELFYHYGPLPNTNNQWQDIPGTKFQAYSTSNKDNIFLCGISTQAVDLRILEGYANEQVDKVNGQYPFVWIIGDPSGSADLTLASGGGFNKALHSPVCLELFKVQIRTSAAVDQATIHVMGDAD